MMKNTIHTRSFLVAAALAFSSWTTCAGSIAIETGEGNVAALLEREANDFTDALGKAVIDFTPSPPLSKTFALLRSKVQGATVARIEYSYEKAGKTVTRVYHGRSGHSLKTIFDRASKKSASSASGNESSATDSGDAIGIIEADDIAMDAAEAKYYPIETGLDLRARKLPESTSRLEASVVDSMDHSWDAELKTLRRIEDDIEKKIVPKGGRVTGYVSKTVCESCREVIDTFARLFDAEGTIYQLIEPGTGSVAGDGATAIQRSRAVSSNFLAMRKAYAKAILNPSHHAVMREQRRSALGDLDRIEQEALAVDEPEHDPCVP
ncbi:hypothetical protein J2T07_003247 [Luteibacter jiangsuensis]|uniref:Secreted protein n=1 Tax=Luteibacter jiangsuensis TaxID=637577 RepID=A0ABT9T191_9GAMM|nr:hypothetical protein [Luteibacter jiangsuensis]MDQ0011041.1 hypothetical protein [Luteibacter jiangsuensis]